VTFTVQRQQEGDGVLVRDGQGRDARDGRGGCAGDVAVRGDVGGCRVAGVLGQLVISLGILRPALVVW
jgi:hypothetical protein